MNSDSVHTGEAIRKELARRGDTQQMAANRFGVGQPSVSRVLKGDFTERSPLGRAMRNHYLGQDVSSEYAHNRNADREFARVVDGLTELWDGTVEGAIMLRSLVDVVRWLKINR